ncbi:MAG: PAS domain S-box protein [Phycisphaerae bacterium]|nr:PAS domain S-box protein [Phycisphaerae bacterium]MCL4719895.1 PAS domain S-box protein [Phycisphaerae bacterium]NUQ08754.1 PAS domain S-box protein [Phycisphaerae bacterium]
MDAIFIIVAVSSLLQLAALVFALRLIPLTKVRAAWILLSVTFGLMLLRRVLSLIEIVMPEVRAVTKGLPSELVALTISILLVLSMWQVREMFLAWQRDRDARRMTEARLAAVFENVPFEIWVSDEHGRPVYRNPVFLRRWPPTSPSSSGSPGFPEPLAGWYTDACRRAASGAVSGEVRYAEGDRERCAYLVVAPVRDGDRFDGTVSISLDMTEQKQIEDELRMSRQRLADVAAHSPGMLFETVLKPDGTFYLSYASQRSRDLLGVEPEALIGPSFDPFSLVTDQDRTMARASIAQSARTLDPFQHEVRVHRFDGRTIWLRSIAAPRRLDNGDTVWTGITMDITDMKAAEQRVAESEQLLSGIIRSAMDAIITINADQRIIQFNAAAEAIFRCAVEDAIGKPIEAFIPARYRPNHRRHVEEFGRTGQTSRRMGSARTLSALRLDGEEFPIEASISRVEVSGRDLFTVILRDITERITSEHALRESERVIRTLLGNLPGMVYRCRNDRDWTIEFVSDGGAELTGCDLEDLRGGRVRIGRDLIHEGDRDRVWEDVQRALEERRPFQIEYRIVRPDGRVRWVWERGQGVFNERGDVLALEGFMTDITERRFAENALRESEARLQAILSHAPNVAIQIFDRQGRVLFWNRAAERLFGFTQEEAVGRTLDQLILDAAGASEFLKLIDHIARTGEHVPPEDWRFTAKDGTCGVVYSGVFPIGFDQDRQAYVCMDIDITARRRAEDALRAANERLEDRVRERTAQLEETNAELEAFTYSVSHDLRAPVRHISSYARILLEEHGADFTGDAKHCASSILASSKKLGRLIDDLLDFSRLGRQAVRREEVDVAAMVDEVWREVLKLYPQGAPRLIVGNLPPAWADPGLLRHVWFNLLENAAKYSAGRPTPEVRVTAFDRGVEHWYAVSDNGVGFDPRYADKLFGVFQRLHREEDFPGTGVGLALVRRIVQKHGGEVAAEGRLDQGATFSFHLPENRNEPADGDSAR